MTRAFDARLRDILLASERIRSAEGLLEAAERTGDVAGEDAAFDAIAYNLVVIGEAVKAIPAPIRHDHPDVPWSQIAGMRDVLAHHYFKVDVTVVRATIDLPLQRLAQVCRDLLLDQ